MCLRDACVVVVGCVAGAGHIANRVGKPFFVHARCPTPLTMQCCWLAAVWLGWVRLAFHRDVAFVLAMFVAFAFAAPLFRLFAFSPACACASLRGHRT